MANQDFAGLAQSSTRRPAWMRDFNLILKGDSEGTGVTFGASRARRLNGQYRKHFDGQLSDQQIRDIEVRGGGNQQSMPRTARLFHVGEGWQPLVPGSRTEREVVLPTDHPACMVLATTNEDGFQDSNEELHTMTSSKVMVLLAQTRVAQTMQECNHRGDGRGGGRTFLLPIDGAEYRVFWTESDVTAFVRAQMKAIDPKSAQRKGEPDSAYRQRLSDIRVWNCGPGAMKLLRSQMAEGEALTGDHIDWLQCHAAREFFTPTTGNAATDRANTLRAMGLYPIQLHATWQTREGERQHAPANDIFEATTLLNDGIVPVCTEDYLVAIYDDVHSLIDLRDAKRTAPRPQSVAAPVTAEPVAEDVAADAIPF